MVLSGALAPTGTSNKTLNLLGTSTLNNTISGNISNGAGGTLGITKNLGGTWVLSGTNTYTGLTTLTAGTLVLAGPGALPSGSTLTWGSTGTTLRFQNDANLAVASTLNTSTRNTTRALVVDRLTTGSAVDLSFANRPNLDCNTVLNLQKGSNITSGTPTITFAGGTGSSDSNNGTIAGGTDVGPVTFSPTGVNMVINNGITSSARTRGYIFQGDSTGNQLNGVFANGSGTAVAKRGSGTWTFTGANLYSSGTTVEAGTLLVNNTTGSGTGTGFVTVKAGTLGGTGSISGAVTIGDGTGSADAILAPGTSIESLATGNLSFGSDGSYAVEVDGTAATSDQTLVTGTVTLNATTALTTNVTGALVDGQKYYVVVNDDVDAVSGAFTGLAQDALVGTFGGIDLKISYTGDSGTSALTGGNDIVLYATSGGGGSPYDTWTSLKGLTGAPGFENGKADDPDKDGVTNLDEFAFDGNPLSGANDGKVVGKIATVGGNQVLTLTLPVRGTTPSPIFGDSGGDQLSALTDGIYYRIEGSVDLSAFTSTITEVTGVDATGIQAGLPALSSGWSYRTFRAPGTVPSTAKAFLRAKISETP